MGSVGYKIVSTHCTRNKNSDSNNINNKNRNNLNNNIKNVYK